MHPLAPGWLCAHVALLPALCMRFADRRGDRSPGAGEPHPQARRVGLARPADGRDLALGGRGRQAQPAALPLRTARSAQGAARAANGHLGQGAARPDARRERGLRGERGGLHAAGGRPGAAGREFILRSARGAEREAPICRCARRSHHPTHVPPGATCAELLRCCPPAARPSPPSPLAPVRGDAARVRATARARSPSPALCPSPACAACAVTRAHRHAQP